MSAAAPPPPPGPFVWRWAGDDGLQDYDAETSRMIDDGYRAGQVQVTLQHGFFGASGGYTIDLAQMLQLKNSSGYARAVQREPPVPPLPPPPGAVMPQKGGRVAKKLATTAKPPLVRADPQVMQELQYAVSLFLGREQQQYEAVEVIEIHSDSNDEPDP